MLILYSYNFVIAVKVFWNFRLQNVCWEQCQTSTIPTRYLGIYLGGILSPVFLLIQSLVRGIVQGFEWVEILGFTVSLLFVQSTIELERGKILPFSNAIVNDVCPYVFLLFCHKWPFCVIMHRFLNDKCSCYSVNFFQAAT